MKIDTGYGDEIYSNQEDMKKYDYLIVGSGLFGSTFAYEMTKAGKKCLIVENKKNIAGNCYTENKDGINIHTYGPHIFHTNDKGIWEWVNQFAEFNNYRHCVRVSYEDKMYSFPINLMTLNQLWKVKTPEEAKAKLKSVSIPNDNPKNLEEWILSQVGEDIYKTFVKGYTTKQWGKSPKELPTFIIKRLPIRTSFDDNYYFDKYQGIPVGGYTKMFEKILEGIEVRLDTDYFSNKEYYNSIAKKVVFTGKIDEFFDYQFGELEYRTLRFVNERLDVEDYQGCAQVNYGDVDVPYTRITEHKHFEKNDSKVTWISKEYSMTYKKGDIPYYPINDDKNNKIYSLYKELSNEYPYVIFGGRLSEYKYYDMHQIIGSALSKVKKELSNESN
jgi:UDP-galactopyranose mutase